MRKYLNILLILTCVFALQKNANASTEDTTGSLAGVISSLKEINSEGYDFIMDAAFPNGEKDRIKGDVYSDRQREFLYNNTDAYTMVCTAKWMYYADHRKKTISIVNLGKGVDKKERKSVTTDLLKYGLASTFLDSIVLKKGKLKTMKREGDELSMELKFPANSTVQTFRLRYDEKKKMPITYDMDLCYPISRQNGVVKTITVKVTCTNFKKIEDVSSINEANFFAVSKGKIELKKFKDYKLLTKL